MRPPYSLLEPNNVVRVRGYSYVVLGLCMLIANVLAGDARWPVFAVVVPLLVVALGLAFALRPRQAGPFVRLAPFIAVATVALLMVAAPPAIAPLGLALIVMSCVFGGMLLPPRAAAVVAVWSLACFVTWSVVSGRPVLADFVAGTGIIGVASVVAMIASWTRRLSIYEAQSARRDAEELSLRDSLTGLAHRRAVDAEAQLRAIEARLGGVLMIDIDHFKNVNDEYGHDAGDAVLKEVGRRLGTAIRGADLAARLGGDEFAVLLDGPLTIEGLRRVADAVRGATSSFATQTAAGQVRITTSIGGALVVAGAVAEQQARSARSRADSALYQAKKAGRDRAVLDGESRAPSARRGRNRPRSGPRAA
jgi:diguanylate cyclase (GGDEF)-like protein